MKILFVTTEHPGNLTGGLGTFTREYIRELRKYCDVKCVYFHLSDKKVPLCDETVDIVIRPEFCFDAFSPDAAILETAASLRSQLEPLLKSFNPDVSHCNDRQPFLPFRFEKNVFYSSHLIFTDLISKNTMNDLYFQEVKVERCTLETSALVASYSEFAAGNIEKLAGPLVSPVVLPLGIRSENFCHKKHSDGKIHVCYFGRFENIQKGVNDFIYAVNLLGPQFKKRNNVEYHLYGHGRIDAGVDISLFNEPEFLLGKDLLEAYANADIVVMPSRYEPFGFTGLEAMASGALLLVRTGLGMDEYAEPGWNCLELPEIISQMAGAIRDAVIDFDKYEIIRENGIRTSREWTWKRCVKSHLYFYRMIARGKISELGSAYRKEYRKLLEKYEKTNDVEKIYCSENERIAFGFLYEKLNIQEKNEKILVMTGCFVPEEGMYPPNLHFISVLNKTRDGVVIRPECLPYKDCEFDRIICAGAWETVLEPCGALMEMERVSKRNVTVLYKSGWPEAWQTFQMENDEDWKALNNQGWDLECYSGFDMQELSQIVPYGAVSFRKKTKVEVIKNEITA